MFRRAGRLFFLLRVLQLAQQYLAQFGNLAKTNNTMIIPSDLANVAGVIKACTSIIKSAEA